MEDFYGRNDIWEGKVKVITKNKLYELNSYNRIVVIIDDIGRWWDIKNKNSQDNFISLSDKREMIINQIINENVHRN